MARTRRPEARVLHNQLARVRAERRLSRADLAERVGVNVQTIGALERGQYYPSLYVAMMIAEACQLPVSDLFSWTPFSSVQATGEDHP